MPSNSPSSRIWRRISSSISCESTSEELIRDRKDDWCSICRAALLLVSSCLLLRSLLRLLLLSSEDSVSGCRVFSASLRNLSTSLLRLLSALSLSSVPLPSRLASLLDVVLVLASDSPLLLRVLLVVGSATPTSLRLKSLTSFISLRSSSSLLLSLKLFSFSSIFGHTSSPGVYLSPSAAFSSTDRPLSGFAARNISSSVVTVALCLVSRTGARHDGQVYGVVIPGGRELGDLR